MALGHGKVILLGEHSVVHGRPALAMSVPLGVEVSARRAAKGARSTTLRIEPWDVEINSVDVHPEHAQLQQALRVAREFYDDDTEVELTATVHLPGGAGMGSSAALGVAVLRALDEVRDARRTDDQIYERSLKWERVFHGNPSGIDNAMATYGGIAMFKRRLHSSDGRQDAQLTRFAPQKPVKVVVAYSGTTSSTKEMVASVARQLEAEPERIGELFDEIASLVVTAKLALEDGELDELGRLMVRNHELLKALHLSTDTLDEMQKRALEAGALGAKVTGAGGGGCLVALVDGDDMARNVTKALEALGKTVYDVGAVHE